MEGLSELGPLFEVESRPVEEETEVAREFLDVAATAAAPVGVRSMLILPRRPVALEDPSELRSMLPLRPPALALATTAARLPLLPFVPDRELSSLVRLPAPFEAALFDEEVVCEDGRWSETEGTPGKWT